MVKPNTTLEKGEADNVSNDNESVNTNQDETHSVHGNQNENDHSDDESSDQSQEDEVTVKKTSTPPKRQEAEPKRNKDGSIRKPRAPAKSKGQAEKKVSSRYFRQQR